MIRTPISIIAAIAGAAAAIYASSTQPAYTQSKPDLVVLIAVDQFSAALFDQWRGRFKFGLKRLIDEGILYSIGPVAVRCPRVRDRAGEGSERIRVSSAILPPYARRSKSLEVLIPMCGGVVGHLQPCD